MLKFEVKSFNYDKVVEAQRDTFKSGLTRDISFRKKQLKYLKVLLQENEEVLYEAIDRDYKKSAKETYNTELSVVYEEIDKAVRLLNLWAKKKRAAEDLINWSEREHVMHEPLGSTLIFSPWNTPFLLSLLPLVSSIAAGNCAIVKPSHITENASAALAQVINRNFDQSYIHVVQGGEQESNALLLYKWDMIMFIGSSETGKKVYQAAARTFSPVTLKTGGKSPAFVLPNTPLKASANNLVKSKFLNAGQTCIAPDYVMVHESIYKPFLRHLKESIVRNDFDFENQNYVQIINDQHFIKLVNKIENSKVIFGGGYNTMQRWIEPTLVAGEFYDSQLASEEVLGPILPIISYKDINEAIDFTSRDRNTFSCYVMGKNQGEINAVMQQLHFSKGASNGPMVSKNGSVTMNNGNGIDIKDFSGFKGFLNFSKHKAVYSYPFWSAKRWFGIGFKDWLRRLNHPTRQ